MKRRLRNVLVFLLLGMATSTLLAWGLAFSMPGPGQLRSARAIIDDRPWHLSVWTGRGWTIVRGGLPVVQAWSAWQATGPPDTPGFGDLRTAWASKTPDGQVEWMRLRYPRPITPRGVEVHETYNPGAVTQISVFTEDGRETIVWSGTDPTPAGAGGGVSRIDFDVSFPVDELKLTIDSPSVRGWNEIDAVALVDHTGTRHWAIDISVSSSYADEQMAPTPRTPRELTPFWCPLDVAAPPNGQAATRTSVERVHFATGLPLRAFRRTVATAPAPRPGGGSILGGGVPALASGGVPSVDHPGQLPFVPIPGGLLFDTIFFAIAWWGLARAVRPLRRFRPVRVVREAHRTRQGRCAACGFDLRFDLAGGCPECGWRRAPGRPVR